MRFFMLWLALIYTGNLQAKTPSNSPITIVAHLYSDYAWEAVLDTPYSAKTGLLDEPPKILRRYFSKRLTELFSNDRECAKRTKEICRLDFLPIWNSQDPAATDLTITPTNKPNSIRVQFINPSNRQKIELYFILIREPLGWRVDNIISDDWDLRSILETSLNSGAIENETKPLNPTRLLPL